MSETKIICRALTGPTASGKSALGLRLARKYGWEIACMDSMQIYRGMDIGTAKPTAEERAMVPHHLLDICDPRESFSVAAYRERAEALVRQAWEQRGREILFVGGTGLYLQALMHPMGMGQVEADESLRAELHALAEQPGGRERLHAMLRELDPDTAARLPLGDVRRMIRAIEVTRGTGIPFSRQPNRSEDSPFQWRAAATALERGELYRRINERVGTMLEAGLREEVAALLRSGVPEDAQSMQGLGYKEMIPCVRGETTVEEAAEQIRMGSRHYAKRQMTFLRRMPEIPWADVAAPDAEQRLEEILR